jgi:creatinine amidohydrolase
MATMTAHTTIQTAHALASHRWAELNTRDFAALDPARTVAVLPLGATEQHGPHLPLSVDTVLVDGVVHAALKHLADTDPVLVLPTQTVGLSTEHTAFAGTLHLSPQTLIHMWCDIGASVARAGVKKLLMFNAHGGNVGLMDVVARELRAQHGLIVYSSSWYNLPIAADVMAQFSAEEHRFGIHAGDIETSMMLALLPERVAMTEAKHFASTSQDRAKRYAVLGDGKSAKFGWHMQDYNPQGAVGNAGAATAAKGEALVQGAGEQLALLMKELIALPLSTVRV